MTKQNETQSEGWSDLPIIITEIIQERRSRSKSNRISKGVCRDSGPSRLPWKKILNLFNKIKAIRRYVRSRIVLSLPHSLALKTILSFDYRNYLKTRLYRSKPVAITRAQGSRLYFAFDSVNAPFQHGLRIFDVGGAGDCLFRVVFHQLYGVPSYYCYRYSITRTRYDLKCYQDNKFCIRRRKQTFKYINGQRLWIPIISNYLL